jgi:hypothetical protein
LETHISQGFPTRIIVDYRWAVLTAVLPICCPPMTLRFRAVFALADTRFAAAAGTAFADVHTRAALVETTVRNARAPLGFGPGMALYGRIRDDV